MKNAITKEMIKDMLKNDYTMLYRPMPKEIKDKYPVWTMALSNELGGLHFTVNHSGKMTGMSSLSTTCKCGKICPNRIKRAVKGYGSKDGLKKAIKANPLSKDFMICGFCFSDSQQDRYKDMVPCLTRNFEILNNGIVHSDWLPILNLAFFRGESFGDFASKNAVINFVNLAKKNRNTMVTVWTKNPAFFYQAFKEVKKPENMIIILSSVYINRTADIPERFRWFIDKVFTVYTKQCAKAESVNINCGARSCLTCLNCYRKDGPDTISELLK